MGTEDRMAGRLMKGRALTWGLLKGAESGESEKGERMPKKGVGNGAK